MSDFQDIMDAPAQEAMEALLWPWTYRLLNKWRTTGLNEEEGRQLIFAWRQKTVTTSHSRQSKRELRFRQRGNMRGLTYPAMLFQKDVKTIKRWCEKGLFPGATKTKGGHWRIPAQAVEQVRKTHPDGFGRRPKKLFGTKIWKEFKVEAPRFFGKLLPRTIEFEAALRDMSQRQFLQAPESPSSKAIDLLASAVKRGRDDYVSFCNLARRLKRENPSGHLNYQLLADALKIVPSTLYRRYTQKGVSSAIKAALVELKPTKTEIEDQASSIYNSNEQSNDDSEAIAEEFGKFVVSDEDARSPFIHVHDPKDQKA